MSANLSSHELWKSYSLLDRFMLFCCIIFSLFLFFFCFYIYTGHVLVFNWNHFEMRLLNLGINFYSLRTFCPRLGSFFLCVVSSCQKIAVSNPIQAGQRFTWSKTWCDRQQLWKAVITGDTVTRLSIPIRGRGKSPEEGQRWNLAET